MDGQIKKYQFKTYKENFGNILHDTKILYEDIDSQKLPVLLGVNVVPKPFGLV